MSQKLTKAQIIGELLAEEQISAEEAITLLSEKGQRIVEKKVKDKIQITI